MRVDHVIQRQTGGLHHALHVLECLLRLRVERRRHLAIGGFRALPRDVEIAIRDHARTVGPDGCRSARGNDRLLLRADDSDREDH